jgi:prepilin-type N-terminal cleavage/methylation domain-containing protein
MTSAHKTTLNKRLQLRAGFTILEIIIATAIVSIILGSAVLFLADQGNGALDKLAQQTQIMAKETLRKAKLKERPYSIHITATKIWVAAGSMQFEGGDIEPPESALIIPEGVSVSLLANNTDKNWFTLSKNDAPFIWTFTQSGLCDSLEIRFEDDDNIQTVGFHSLTAGEIIDEN